MSDELDKASMGQRLWFPNGKRIHIQRPILKHSRMEPRWADSYPSPEQSNSTWGCKQSQGWTPQRFQWGKHLEGYRMWFANSWESFAPNRPIGPDVVCTAGLDGTDLFHGQVCYLQGLWKLAVSPCWHCILYDIGGPQRIAARSPLNSATNSSDARSEQECGLWSKCMFTAGNNQTRRDLVLPRMQSCYWVCHVKTNTMLRMWLEHPIILSGMRFWAVHSH
jgi:hypothetical protein